MTLPTTPSFRLDGRRALVTGAGRGIGLAAAKALADAGAEVTLAARTASEIEAAAAAIGQGARAAVLDVSDLAAVAAFFAGQDPFHVLVNNAGTNRPKPMWDVSEADYDAVLDLNLKSAFFVAQACVRRMIESGTTGSLIQDSPLMNGIGLIITLFFFVPGLVYGLVAGKIRSGGDLAGMMTSSMASMGGFIVIVFFAAQMLAFFNWSNLGTIIAVKGAELAKGQKAQGADVIYAAAGGTGVGVLQAAADEGILSIGVDSNQ
ncbi:MAG TPA: SDR family NAD(P)-dependent oxidoreductase, partial [Ottowia sp.]|nr:SDR family NAD(P)-dependent oxidoreductase [Ottowia sp.]